MKYNKKIAFSLAILLGLTSFMPIDIYANNGRDSLNSNNLASENINASMSFSGVNDFKDSSNGINLENIREKQKYNIILKDNGNYQEVTQNFIEKVKNIENDAEILEIFDSVFAGISLNISKNTADILKDMADVDTICLDKSYPDITINAPKIRKRRDAASNEIIHKNGISTEYDGRSMAVAIIDSGADVSHSDFRLDDGIDGKITETQVNTFVQNKKYGSYINKKIPFVYDYADLDNDVKEGKNESHGMHVAGITAANPTSNKNVTGVAPNAQLLIMKVFGNRGMAQTSAYIKAIEDCIALNVDAINMSLGAGGGSLKMEDPSLVKVIEKARKKGIVVAIAGGNDGYFGMDTSTPTLDCPDYGLTAMPGILPNALTSASIENTKSYESCFAIENVNDKFILHSEFMNIEKYADKANLYSNFMEVAYRGLGKEENFKNDNANSLKDKITLIDRGEIYFKEKIANAKKHGATFVLIANNKENGDNLISMDTDDKTVLTAMISYKDGEYLKTNTSTTKLKALQELKLVNNPLKGKISEFSSFGLTSDGILKPDITAPGGKIYSTINNNSYATLSGTSMASPHVAGALAIVKQRINKEFSGISDEEKFKLAKNLLMSTATPHKRDDNLFSSPRQQGAGVLNLYAALNTPAIIYGNDGISSINLGSIKNNNVDINATLKNLTDKELKYTAKIYLTTDKIENGKYILEPISLNEKEIGNYTINANSTCDVNYTININDLKSKLPLSKYGNYLDGFIVFTSTDATEISIPFSGFIGDFANLPVLEDDIYTLLKNNKRPIYSQDEDFQRNPAKQPDYTFTHLSTADRKIFKVLGETDEKSSLIYDASKIAISPNADGIHDYVRFYGTFLRSYMNMKFTFKDSNGRVIYETNPNDLNFGRGVKNFSGFADAGKKRQTRVTTVPTWRWPSGNSDTDPGKTDEPDGNYKLIISVSPLIDGAIIQEKEYDIIVDTAAPEIEKSSYNEDTQIFTLEKIKADLSGIKDVKAYYKNGADKSYINVDEKSDGTYTIDVKNSGKTMDEIYLYISDFAGNTYDYPLSTSIRDDKARLIIRERIDGEGNIPSFENHIYDESGAEISKDNLQKNTKYKLVTTFNDDGYEIIDGNEREFTLTDENATIIINLTFRKIQKFSVTTYVKDYILKNVGNVGETIDITDDNKENDTYLSSDAENIIIKLINIKTNEEIMLEKDKSSTFWNWDFRKDVKSGIYRIKAEGVIKDFKPIFFDENNTIIDTINVEKRKGYMDRFSINLTFIKNNGSVTPAPSYPKNSKIWFQEAATNEYKAYGDTNPIIFIIKDKNDDKKIFYHRYGSKTDYEISLPYGEYVISADVKGYDFKLDVVNDNIIKLDSTTDNHESALFIFSKKSSSPTPTPPVPPTPTPTPPTPTPPMPPTPTPPFGGGSHNGSSSSNGGSYGYGSINSGTSIDLSKANNMTAEKKQNKKEITKNEDKKDKKKIKIDKINKNNKKINKIKKDNKNTKKQVKKEKAKKDTKNKKVSISYDYDKIHVSKLESDNFNFEMPRRLEKLFTNIIYDVKIDSNRLVTVRLPYKKRADKYKFTILNLKKGEIYIAKYDKKKKQLVFMTKNKGKYAILKERIKKYIKEK